MDDLEKPGDVIPPSARRSASHDEARGHIPLDSCHESGTPAAWNERYTTRGMVWGTEPNQFVADFATGLSPCRVLDLGCGQGRNTVWLATQGHTVTGIDQSDLAVAQARQLATDCGVYADFVVADIVEEWTPPPESFDLVVLSYLQLPEECRAVAHAKVVEALAPGGTVFLVAHHANNIEHGVGGPPYPEVLFDEAGLAADFTGLRILRNEKCFRDVEGDDGVIRSAHDILLEAVKPVHR